jgi:hypothetical protein
MLSPASIARAAANRSITLYLVIKTAPFLLVLLSNFWGAVHQAIPFFGFLLGFAAIGHKVWVFEGHSSAMRAGCQNSDILLVDGGILPFLGDEKEWRTTAMDVMRGNEIKIIPR